MAKYIAKNFTTIGTKELIYL